MRPTTQRLAGGAAMAIATAAGAQCPAIDFENLAVGTAVTTQYPGVTFSVAPQSCGGAPALYLRVRVPTGGTSSGTKCLQIDTGCPDFSPDYLRMVFDRTQREVSFTLGDFATTYIVRAYSTTSGTAGLISSTNVVIEGTGYHGVHRVVRVLAPAANLRRVEVQAANDLFESIDDLRFDIDTTPPTAQIDSPGYEACGCSSVTVRGLACDSDGAYDRDVLEYRRVDALPGTPWASVGSANSPVCTPGNLYLWNTSAVAEGFYYLRLTVYNECGLSSSDQSVVYVDKSFTLAPSDVRSPVPGAVVGGDVCVDGTAWDWCFDSFTVRYRAAGGSWAPVDPAHPSYSARVVTDPLGVWNTRSGVTAVPDGSYEIEVRGTDSCDNQNAVVRPVVVDNTAPTTLITTPSECSYVCGVVTVRGTVTDPHLASWVLEYTGGPSHGWTTIASGSGPIVNGTLGSWNVANLVPCDYTLRLRATDSASVSCDATRNQSEYLTSLHVGAYANCDNSTTPPVLNVNDFICFQSKFVAGCP
jgi:hypothetical protein